MEVKTDSEVIIPHCHLNVMMWAAQENPLFVPGQDSVVDGRWGRAEDLLVKDVPRGGNVIVQENRMFYYFPE